MFNIEKFSSDGPRRKELRPSLNSIALMFTFVIFLLLPFLSGIRHISHDSVMLILPWRQFVSDCIHSGRFPFWDPISSPGVAVGADISGATGLYYPIAIILETLFHYSHYYLVLEIFLTLMIGALGTFAWIRRQGISEVLSVCGAIAFVGAASTLDTIPNFSVLISICFLPWLFYGIESIFLEPSHSDSMRGIIPFAVSGWCMVTGGYAGLNYAAALYGGIWFTTIVILTKPQALIRRSLHFSAGLLILFSLVILPISEFLITDLGRFKELRHFSGEVDSFLGSMKRGDLFSLFFINNSAFGLIPGFFQIYMSLGVVATLLIGLLSREFRRKEIALILIGTIVMLSSMGPRSLVASFFSRFVPGFKMLRWHYFYSPIAALLFISAGLGMQDRVLNLGKKIQLKIPCILPLFLFIYILISGFKSFHGQATHPSLVTRFDVYFTSALTLFLAGVFTVLFKRGSRFREGSIILAGTASIVLAVLLVFRPFFIRMDNSWINSSTRIFLITDFVHLILVGGGLLGVFNFSRRLGVDGAKVLFTFLVFLDLAVASQCYFQGQRYWHDTQYSGDQFRSAQSVVYDSNVRSKDLPGFGSALYDRKPVIKSYQPSFDPTIASMAADPNTAGLFSKLVWLVPPNTNLQKPFWEKNSTSEILTVELQPNAFRVATKNHSKALLIASDAWNPGWTVRVNGVFVPLIRVMGALKAVDLESGENLIEFRYLPKYFGLAIFAFILGISSILYVVRIT